MEENNEIMMTENEVTGVSEETNALGAGTAMMIGGLLAIGLMVGGKKLKKIVDDHRKKKGERFVETTATNVSDSDYESVEDDEE